MEKELKIEKPEIKEKEPKISYHILYGPHRTAKDFEKLEQAFKKADVYAPEITGWTPELSKEYFRVSQGKMKPEDMAKKYNQGPDSFFYKELQIIEGSEKPILFFDLPRGHELLKERKEKGALKFYARSFRSFMNGEFQSALQAMRQYTEIIGDYYSKREKIIKENLKEKAQDLAKWHKELKKEKEIKVLVKLGAAHTPVYHQLKREKAPASWEFAYLPTIFTYGAEAHRQFRLVKDKELSDELLAKCFIEELIHNNLEKVTDDSNKMIMVARKISSGLSLKDIADISKEFGESPKKTIVDCLKERNIKIPKTEEEMDEMLKVKNNN